MKQVAEISPAAGVSPMGAELRNDPDGVVRDEIQALFDELAAQASHAVRRPQSHAEFERNNALMDAAYLARQIVGDYWARHNTGR